MRRLRILTSVTLGAALALVAVGGLVRATGSGLGCPGWPKCFGRWIPPLRYHALIEYSHRLLTTVVIVLIAWLLLESWRRGYRRRAVVAWSAAAAMVLILIQAALGAAVVKSELNPALVTAHYANAMLLVASLVFATVGAFVDLRFYRAEGAHRRFALHALGVTVATYGVILLGTYVRAKNAGLVFTDWPLMNGGLIPKLTIPLAGVQFAHRLAVFVVFLGITAMVAVAWRRERDRPAVRAMAILAGALFVAQAMLGAAIVWTHLSVGSRVAHEAMGALVWAALVGTSLLAFRLAPTSFRPSQEEREVGEAREPAPIAGAQVIALDPPATLADRAGAYLALTKPRIIILLLITTVPAMILAKGGLPSLGLVLATLFGGTLAAGSANAINCYIDRDIDQVMRRTRRRPLPANRVDPGAALRFGIVLGAASFVFLAFVVNLVAASLSTAAILFYVFVYTLGMKRSTPQNIVIGGAAGAAPVLVGWAAVTGHVGLPAVVMFLIVFYWTPPHFWALSIQYEQDYRDAGVPMLPVVRGLEETTRQILLYSFLLLSITILLIPVGRMGLIYGSAALVLGGWFIVDAIRLRREPTLARAMRLFHFSNSYLALLFAAIAIDPLVRSLR